MSEQEFREIVDRMRKEIRGDRYEGCRHALEWADREGYEGVTRLFEGKFSAFPDLVEDLKNRSHMFRIGFFETLVRIYGEIEEIKRE